MPTDAACSSAVLHTSGGPTPCQQDEMLQSQCFTKNAEASSRSGRFSNTFRNFRSTHDTAESRKQNCRTRLRSPSGLPLRLCSCCDLGGTDNLPHRITILEPQLTVHQNQKSQHSHKLTAKVTCSRSVQAHDHVVASDSNGVHLQSGRQRFPAAAVASQPSHYGTPS